ncbi:MAG: cytochrome b5-like heme/steroid binding domain-containing protein [Patescibacteria group bacterium]
MEGRLVPVAVGALLTLVIGGQAYVTKQASFNPPTEQLQASGATLTTVAKHNSRSSCWSAINGSVYDLTSWIPNHPGGKQAILSLCGIDGSQSFNNQHGGSSKVARILGGFKIGTLN